MVLGSPFGRRLLLLFIGSALVPTLLVAVLSFQSVRSQLATQSEDRLHATANSIQRVVYDRLETVDADLRRNGASLVRCAGGAADSACGDELTYPFPAAALYDPATGTVRALVGNLTAATAALPFPKIAGGSSAVVADLVGGKPRLIMLHHIAVPGGDGPILIGELSLDFLWTPADADMLPESILFAWIDPAAGILAAKGESPRLGGETAGLLGSAPSGGFEWSGAHESYLAAYRSFPMSRRLQLPAWRVVASESTRQVLAPMADFTKIFPLLLILGVVVVAGFALSQIRRSLVPLMVLQRGTRRVTGQDFETRVEVTSGDEFEELAASFNAMAGQLGRQFRSVTTAAEIDRAVLSSVDRATIVDTALKRLPELVPCEALGIALLDGADGSGTGLGWWANGAGRVEPAGQTIAFSPADLSALRARDEQLVYRPDRSVPQFVADIIRGGSGTINVLPLRFGGILFGAMAVRRGAGAGSDSADLTQIGRLADHVAVALSNARMVDRVKFLAFYDNLTGLPNRMLYKERLTQALQRAARSRRHVAVCFLDLDHFSAINDTLGHDLGDQLIRDVAARLSVCCRETDTISRLVGDCGQPEVSRLGGDEFTVVLPDLTDAQDADRVARRILDCFGEPFRLGTNEMYVSTSIGIAVYPEDGHTIEDLVKNADVAMYHAKENGRNTCRLYSPAMNSEAMGRMRLDQQLRRAVDAGQFAMVYQPIVNTELGTVVGAEALVRWNHPERGLLSPGEFISLTEESGLIVRLGEWILRTVCAQGKVWADQGLGPLRLSVNLSGRQLQRPDIVDLIREILGETKLPPQSLVLELTESVLMQPDSPVAASIQALAALGVQFAIDDFGTGYSSLSYLKHFPADTLKIDRSFITDVLTDPDDAAITCAVIALGKALGISVVAEGVETEAQAAYLAQSGCQLIQGYFVGQPMPPEEFAAFFPVLGSRLRAGMMAVPG